MKKLYFIIGNRKSGTSFLFNSISNSIWKPPVKDRDWLLTEDFINDFLSSNKSFGVIAKADAILDLNKLCDILDKYKFIQLVIMRRNIINVFESFSFHEYKKDNNIRFGTLVKLFNEEQVKVSSNFSFLSNNFSLDVFEYEDLSNFSKYRNDLFTDFSPSSRYTNSSRESYLFYGFISRLVNLKFYIFLNDTLLMDFLKRFYLKFFRKKQTHIYNKIYVLDGVQVPTWVYKLFKNIIYVDDFTSSVHASYDGTYFHINGDKFLFNVNDDGFFYEEV